jgi:3-hydroxyisobutyrate dehydrogenase-like beta-hydroxyacid dehydrogenase
MKVGFIGLGHMGAGMAANLLKAGHELTVYNRTRARAEPLAAHGAKIASTPAEACAGDAVVTMLANDDAVESVVFGPKGVLASLAKGAIHISSSTISVALSERLTQAHAEAGQRFVAAPVFGRPDAAAAGQLYVVAAGASDALEDVAPLFDAIAQKTFTFSETPSAANLVKLSGNFLSASVVESLGEAMALVAKAGIDRHQYLEFLTSTLFAAPIYKTYGKLIVDGKFEPAAFAAPLGEKDIRLALAAAEQLRVPMPFASLLHDRFLALLANGGDKLDWSAIGELAAKDAGEVRELRGANS